MIKNQTLQNRRGLGAPIELKTLRGLLHNSL